MITIDFSKLGGIVPVVAQDWKTGEVLMVAFMNEDAWRLTKATGIMHYWSRTREKLWKKGETSGNIQEVKELRVGCENDSILAKIRQIGDAACHTGYRSCYYRVVEGESLRVDGLKVFDPKDKYGAAG
jgi:phosphoribosyl-AMP cyclohydrolase